ncbi:MAG: PDZ domain-containing protein [Flavobacteriales bacterium]|nr:PDZ domain-containing protein [Flavobacteriales bacterium]MCL4281531.1 PDZ domain-containing protein [Flavobacteriales bacterium]
MRKLLPAILALVTAPVLAQPSTAATKLQALLYQIDNMYVDSVDDNKLVDKAIVSMLAELDPHSVYIPKEDLEQVNEPLKGNFEGVGIQFNIVRDTIYVVDAIAGGPSERVGIRAGDRVVSVNDSTVAGTGVKNADVIKLLRGPKGTKVNVGVIRQGETDLLDFTITRDKIPIYSIEASYMAAPGVGYIKVSRFGATTTKELTEKLDELKKQGMKDLILDLQGNGGGYLRSAIEMADQFLDDRKLIVYTEGRATPREDTYATDAGSFPKGHLVVMIDEGSASASEIVTGAMQDWDRAVVVGRRSFGKGLVQRPVMLPDGSAVRLTVSRYYTPSGRCIQKSYADGLEAYRHDRIERLHDGELTNADSIHVRDTVKYYTNNKRVVYGGGGIIPDVFVPIDTTLSSAWFGQLVRKGITNTTALNYVDRNRSKLTRQYRTVDDFIAGFTVEADLEDLLQTQAMEAKIEPDSAGMARSKPLVDLRLKALIARDLWDTSAYWKVINSNNPVDRSYDEALKVVQDPALQRAKLAER